MFCSNVRWIIGTSADYILSLVRFFSSSFCCYLFHLIVLCFFGDLFLCFAYQFVPGLWLIKDDVISFNLSLGFQTQNTKMKMEFRELNAMSSTVWWWKFCAQNVCAIIDINYSSAFFKWSDALHFRMASSICQSVHTINIWKWNAHHLRKSHLNFMQIHWSFDFKMVIFNFTFSAPVHA